LILIYHTKARNYILRYKIISNVHTLKEYFLFFTAHTLFYSIIFLNYLCSSYSKYIIYINYHPYFIIFYVTNFFSLILISTNIIFESIFGNSISNYPIIIRLI
jgi:hypothetical protein